MKVVCDACQAKYQIPDERVAGRKLKIRCRKCGGTIVVRGDYSDHAALESLAPPSTEWHVSRQGDQQGPYPLEQVADLLHGGQLAWDAYVWHEGYGGWKLAGESDTLVRAVARVSAGVDEAPTTTAPAPSDPGDDTPTRMVQSSPGLASDVLPPSARSAFAARSASRASQPPHAFAAAAAASAHPSQPAHAYAANAGFTAQRAAFESARVDAEAALTGERHEDSVLFSARNLHTTPVVASVSRPGHASAEGSGLIDIRALAMLARTNQSAPAPSNDASTTGQRPRDEVMALANQTGAFGRIDSLAPLDRPSRAPNNAVPVAILGGSAMIAVAAVFAIYLSRPTAPAPQTVAVAASAPVEPAPSIAPQNEPSLREAPEAAGGPTAAAAKLEQAEAANVAPEAMPAVAQKQTASEAAAKLNNRVVAAKVAQGLPKRAHVADARTAKTGEPKATDSELPLASDAKPAKKESSPSIDELLGDKKPDAPKAGKADDAVAGTQPKAKEPTKSRSIDDLLDEAVPTKEAAAAKKAAAAEAAGSALPETPSREQVLSAMRGVDPEVQACAAGQPLETPTASVAFTVAGANGRPSSVRVTGVAGAIGSCIARAVRNASFPKFARAQFSINYPFKLKK
jgi:predicted Zn finger-like uncharacterized protein